VEVARLVKELPGARFGAVAFAGEPMGLPLSADGAAIAQFFRQLDPNDMPVGGTAIARALDHAANLLKRDPKSADHTRIILLVTDGEDLEGDPVAVARGIGADGTTVHVVQIGGRTPERIPEVAQDGRILGFRNDHNGKPLMTWLSVDGEKQLGDIAAATPDGQIIRAEHGSTGIEKVAAQIRAQMKGELSERVETVYADVYFYPLGLAILLLVIETFIGESALRRFVPRRAPGAVVAASSGSEMMTLSGMPSFLTAAMREPSGAELLQRNPREQAKSSKKKKPSAKLERTVERAILGRSDLGESGDFSGPKSRDDDGEEGPRGKAS
jgi:Ca-activated chloride channel family protein